MQSFDFVFDFRLLVTLRLFPTQGVKQLTMCNGGEPGAGVVWRAFLFPARGRGNESFLQSLFRQIERVSETNQGGDDPPVLFPVDPFESFIRQRHTYERVTASLDVQLGPCLITG